MSSVWPGGQRNAQRALRAPLREVVGARGADSTRANKLRKQVGRDAFGGDERGRVGDQPRVDAGLLQQCRDIRRTCHRLDRLGHHSGRPAAEYTQFRKLAVGIRLRIPQPAEQRALNQQLCGAWQCGLSRQRDRHIVPFHTHCTACDHAALRCILRRREHARGDTLAGIVGQGGMRQAQAADDHCGTAGSPSTMRITHSQCDGHDVLSDNNGYLKDSSANRARTRGDTAFPIPPIHAALQ